MTGSMVDFQHRKEAISQIYERCSVHNYHVIGNVTDHVTRHELYKFLNHIVTGVESEGSTPSSHRNILK